MAELTIGEILRRKAISAHTIGAPPDYLEAKPDYSALIAGMQPPAEGTWSIGGRDVPATARKNFQPMIPPQAPKAPAASPFDALALGDGYKRKSLPLTDPMGPTPQSEITPPPKAMPAEKEEPRLGLSRGTLDAFKTFAEGAGNFHAPVAGEILLGQNRKEPFIAEGIRERMDIEDDQLTPEEQSMFKEIYGRDLPKGMTRSRLKLFLPGFVQYLSTQEAQAGHDRRMIQAQEARDTAFETTQDRRDIRQEKAQEFSDRKAYESAKNTFRGSSLSAKTIVDAKNSIRAAGKVSALLKHADNPTAVRSAIIAVAKYLSGEVGVLTQRDVDAYEGAIGIKGWLTQVEKFGTSAYTKPQLDNLRLVADTLGKANKRALESEKNSRIKGFYATNKSMADRHGEGERDMFSAFGDAFDAGSGEMVPMFDPETGEQVGEVYDDEVVEARRRGAVTKEELSR